MFKKMFGKKQEPPKTVTILAPVNGRLLSLKEVPDPVFSRKMMGDGMAIEPSEGKIVSPVKGEVVLVFPTKHAIGIKAENGAELLVHIGLETVSMNGEGFTTYVSQGDKVEPGDTLVTFDLPLVKEKAKSIVTPIVVTNADDMEAIEKGNFDEVTNSQSEIMTVTCS
ncbi:PTS glucose transporter subunit IIA [Pseudobacillus sp. 179-B 2D1 NHS]|uniref:PTS glucose transporter subunit IIA n=1 Tax=Pseudobacillus sp. 179-B 2D1 NHS TaxID=3374292 RepID=UPI0038799B23